MSAHFCRYCGASVSVEARFCTGCGNSLTTTSKIDVSTTKDLKFDRITGPPQREFSNVPEWNTYYPNLSDANAEQRKFYAVWKSNLEKGIALDIKGNLSYLFVYAYDAIYRFIENKDINQLVARFELLKQGYSNYDKISYLDGWLADAWLYLGNYDEAWQILRQASKLSFEDILNIRARCSDTAIDGNDLLSVMSNGLTKFGRAHREEIANLATNFLKDFHQKNGMNFVEHFCKQSNYASLTQSDIDTLEAFFPKEKEFTDLKWEWQFEQRHPKPKRNETYLFSAVPFSVNLLLRIAIDPKTHEVDVTQNESIQQPRIPSEELPRIIERALRYELKKTLAECEDTVKKESKKAD
jgi:hypothetical protein